MSSLFVLIPVALLLLAAAIWAFLWAVDHDQFEELDRAATSILYDDDLLPPANQSESAGGDGKAPATGAVRPDRRED
jgi:cbb3-type cytochrome oxidase maturation protein